MTDFMSTAVEKYADEARSFLEDMIRCESTPGSEAEVIRLCGSKFSEAGCESEFAPLSDEIKNDPEYSSGETEMFYEGRSNLVARIKGSGGGRSVILQSHVDVVPAGDWEEAFTPTWNGSDIIGRGACDAKGQVAAIWLALRALRETRVKLSGDIQAQVVVEEELGGNGALSLIRQGYRADAVVIIEGTDLNIHPANRGAIWFKLEIEGLPKHMGRKHEGISAIDLSYKVIQALYEYEEHIVADSADYPGFERYDRPVQVNIGTLNAGSWPSMVAERAVIEGGVGFLPNRSMEQVRNEIREVIEGIDDPWLQEHYKLSFPRLHNDSYEIDYSHPLVTTMEESCRKSELDSDVYGWNVSCDARLYAKVAGLPTIVFGPGSISDAHARGEKLDFRELTKAAEALARFLIDWCGKAHD